MPLENVGKFYAKLGEDRALLEKVTKAGEGLKDLFKTNEEAKEKALSAVYPVLEPLAREAGCPFTLHDLERYQKEKLRQLTDEELEAASGGGKPEFITATCACVVAGAGQQGNGIGMMVCIIAGALTRNGVACLKDQCWCAIGGGGTFNDLV